MATQAGHGGKAEALAKILCDRQPATDKLAKIVGNEVDYFQRNTDRTRYSALYTLGRLRWFGGIEADRASSALV